MTVVNPTGVNVGEFLPMDRGFLSWTSDPILAAGSGIPAAGTVTGSRFRHPGGVITNLYVAVVALGVSLTAGQCAMGIVDGTGALVATTADISGLFGVSGVVVAVPLTAPINLPAGVYRAVMLFNNTAGVNPTLARVTAQSVTDLAAVPPSFRGFSANTGVTALPGVLGAEANLGLVYWIATS